MKILSFFMAIQLFMAPAIVEAQTTITRGPYLQSLLDRSVVVMWQASLPGTGKVKCWTEGGPEFVAEDPTAGTSHRVPIAGLAPGTAYRYQILDGDAVIGDEGYRFRTSPLPDGGAIRIAVAGDTGSGDANQAAVALLIEEMAPDIFVHTGDLIYISSPDNAIFKPYRKILPNACLFPSFGNHGDDLLDWPALFSLPQESPKPAIYYSFDWGSAHFAALDTENDFGVNSSQLKWLDGDLEAAKSKGLPWTILFFHRPPYDVGFWGWDAPRIRSIIAPLIDKHRVDLVLNGHDHNYQRNHPVRDGVIHDAWQSPDFISPMSTLFIVTGGGGGVLYQENMSLDHRFTERFISTFHCLRMEITSTKISIDAISAEKATIDSFAITKGEPRPDPKFVRGDGNLDGELEITDVILLLNQLFMKRPMVCPAAGGPRAGDGPIAIDDAVYIVEYLFLAGPPPESPFPACGPAQGADDSWCMRTACR